MTNSSNREWLDWVAVQKKALKLKLDGYLGEAIEEITAFLAAEQPPDLHCDALCFRAMLEEDHGAIELAKSDLLQAKDTALPSSYKKYTIEISLAGLYEKSGEFEAAGLWYIEALKTVISDPTTSEGPPWQAS